MEYVHPLQDTKQPISQVHSCVNICCGAYLLYNDILTVSFTSGDNHEARVQFAIERGVSTIIVVLPSTRSSILLPVLAIACSCEPSHGRTNPPDSTTTRRVFENGGSAGYSSNLEWWIWISRIWWHVGIWTA